MKKQSISFLIIFFVVHSLYPVTIPGLSYAHSCAQKLYSSVASSFAKGKREELVFALPTHSTNRSLSPFQQQFRSTVQIADNQDATLSLAMELTMHEANRSIFSIQALSHTFLAQLEQSGTDYIKKIMKETLDIEVDSLQPAVARIKEHLLALQKNIKPLKQLPLQAQLEELKEYLFSIKAAVDTLMNSSFLRISAAVATGSFTGIDQHLVDAFKDLYHAYPKLISEINTLEIALPGTVVQSCFNEGSELIEQLEILHSAAGKIGTLLVQPTVLKPLDSAKNQIRKLGNSIEFTTHSSPIIVVAPPTTYGAMLEVFKTFAWGPGIYLKPMVQQEIDLVATISQDMIKKIKPMAVHAHALERMANNLSTTIQTDFTTAIKESPLVQIPRAPQLLLEVVENHVGKLKRKLNKTVTLSSLMIQEMSMLLASASTLLGYVNQYMGATAEKPFINNDIIRGVGFIGQDVDTLSYTIKDINAEIASFTVLGIG